MRQKKLILKELSRRNSNILYYESLQILRYKEERQNHIYAIVSGKVKLKLLLTN